jgi:hypothetical protein
MFPNGSFIDAYDLTPSPTVTAPVEPSTTLPDLFKSRKLVLDVKRAPPPYESPDVPVAEEPVEYMNEPVAALKELPPAGPVGPTTFPTAAVIQLV